MTFETKCKKYILFLICKNFARSEFFVVVKVFDLKNNIVFCLNYCLFCGCDRSCSFCYLVSESVFFGFFATFQCLY